MTISLKDLPEGTAAIRLPSGDIIQIDPEQSTYDLSVSPKDINEEGEMVIIALDKENTPLGNYQLDLSDDAWQNGMSHSEAGTIPILIWIAAGVLIIGGAAGAIVVFLNKRK